MAVHIRGRSSHKGGTHIPARTKNLSKSERNRVSKVISSEIRSGVKQDQAAAIAFSKVRRARKGK